MRKQSYTHTQSLPLKLTIQLSKSDQRGKSTIQIILKFIFGKPRNGEPLLSHVIGTFDKISTSIHCIQDLYRTASF